MDSDGKVFSIIGGVFALGVIFQFMGCWLWSNWWPLLTAFAYILVPMPYLFFGGDSYGGGLDSGWVDAGKFLTGSSCVATVAVPSILYHAGKITLGALWMEIIAVFLMGGALIAYDVTQEERSGGGFYSAF
ncbi:hypothetical protein M9434_006873 [Picochlorum sp. BPE23]|nr:hypothetical protein M9434_006873 [Picochlorum sp. BPE23]|eukprot:jgi/Picre1/31696/NNA_007047.t1